MKNSDINIRDPFVLVEGGKFYLYGTRAYNFGQGTGGFDVYVSTDLEEWSAPHQCFDSAAHSMNVDVNWAPEVHKYNGRYYMFATFTRAKEQLRGVYALVSDSPMGPFVPHSDGVITPAEWECLDGTLYIENDIPYLVFAHEHTQIIDGTMCYIELSRDLKRCIGEPVTMFKASDPEWVQTIIPGEHYVTDGPFMYRTPSGVLLMLWSTFIQRPGSSRKYAECVIRFENGSIKDPFTHLAPLSEDEDGGHGMLFHAFGKLYLAYHTPNNPQGAERPKFLEIHDLGNKLEIAPC